ncbi:MAG: GNAT family N-acetyltransferase [Chloroflexi bacterium]|nr:GNAT family N-acetyltransferase [Chloroflexota bacterium]
MNNLPTLTIRGYRSDDWDNLFALLTHPDIVRDSTRLPYAHDETLRDLFSSLPANLHCLVAETSLPSGRTRIIGLAELKALPRRRRHAGTLQQIMHPDYHTGEAPAALLGAVLDLADNWLGLRRIEATLYVDQTDLIAFYEQHGFQAEATLRRYALRAGAYCDAVLLARLLSGERT